MQPLSKTEFKNEFFRFIKTGKTDYPTIRVIVKKYKIDSVDKAFWAFCEMNKLQTMKEIIGNRWD